MNRVILKNEKPYPPFDLDSVEIFEGVKNFINAFQESNWLELVVTNQLDVACNVTSKKNVQKINSYLKSILQFNEIYACYHDNDDFCDCRKPKPRMLVAASKKIILKNE